MYFPSTIFQLYVVSNKNKHKKKNESKNNNKNKNKKLSGQYHKITTSTRTMTMLQQIKMQEQPRSPCTRKRIVGCELLDDNLNESVTQHAGLHWSSAILALQAPRTSNYLSLAVIIEKAINYQ